MSVLIEYGGNYYPYDVARDNTWFNVNLYEITPVQPVLSAVKLPSGAKFEINSYKTNSIPFGIVDDTSTATSFTATVPGVKRLEDGTCVLLKNGVVTSASGFTININGLGAKPVFSNLTAATRDTTIFNINYTMLFVYDSTRVVDSITGAWCCYRGYDANTNTIGYQVRTNSYSLPMKSITYRYRLLFTSADGNYFVPATNSTSTNATASRTVCQDKIDPFGKIVYYGTTASVAADSRPAVANLWLVYTLSLGYSFNRTGAALTLTSWKPVYVKCAPQTDGSAIIDSTTPYVQDLPSTEDGKIYIFLGVAYSATNIELNVNHPVYYYKDGAVRLWTNAPDAETMIPITTSEINQMWGIVNTIDFYLGWVDDPQHAEEGMTWREWVNTEYNTHGLTISGNYLVIGEAMLDYNGAPVNPDDTIIADTWDGTGVHVNPYGWEE